MGGTSSGGAGGGRSQSGLAAGRAVVRLPAHTIIPGSSAEGSPRTGAEAHPDSLDGLNEAVVRRPVRAGVPGADAGGPLSEDAVAGSVGGEGPAVSLTAGALPARGLADHIAPVAARREAISGILRRRGVTETVIPYAVAPQRASTTALYDKQWEAYVRFCRGKNIHPLDSTESTVAEYLISMFEGGAKPATIKVHRSSILSVLVHTAPELQSSLVIGNCLRSFERDSPRQRRVLPKFDINLVLWQLLRPPFTNQDSSLDRDIPLDIFVSKVAFLLALACGSRASEMHALC